MSKKHTHHLVVESATAPTVELDPGSSGVYIRFSNKPVHKTIEQTTGYPIILVDLDKSGGVIGIESVGFTNINVRKIKEITQKANVTAPATMDWESAAFKATSADLHAVA